MPTSPSRPDTDSAELAEKVRSGEYFREMRQIYHTIYDDPMAERYLYMVLTAISVLIMLVTLMAANAFLPLTKEVPFIYKIQDIVEDLPRMQRLGPRGIDANYLIKRFLLSNYVNMREQYEVRLLDRNANGIRSQSTPEVYDEFQRMMDPRNPQSPITLFQRQSTRKVEILSVAPSGGAEDEMEVVYNEIVQTDREIKKTPMAANIAFRFSNIEIDQETNAFTPLEFVVTRYQTRRLQD